MRCTVVYIGTVAIGLTIIEMSEDAEVRLPTMSCDMRLTPTIDSQSNLTRAQRDAAGMNLVVGSRRRLCRRVPAVGVQSVQLIVLLSM